MTAAKKAVRWTALAAFLAGLIWLATKLPRQPGQKDLRPLEQREADRFWDAFQER